MSMIFKMLASACVSAARAGKCRSRQICSRHRSGVIEIINNTRGGIEGKIGERDDWGANSSPGCSLIHDVPDKKVVLDGFFNCFSQ